MGSSELSGIAWSRYCDTILNTPVPLFSPALESAVVNLNEAKTYFAKVDCKEQLRDVLYYQARLFHTLGKTPERNKCAMLFRQLHQELPAHGVPLINAFK